MVIIRIPSFPIIGHRKVEIKAKLKRILYPDIPPRSATIFNVLKMLIAMVIDGDHVMVRDVIYCSRFFQNWHSPELFIRAKFNSLLYETNRFHVAVHLSSNRELKHEDFSRRRRGEI